MIISKLVLFINTVKFLKCKQIAYRALYILKTIFVPCTPPNGLGATSVPLSLLGTLDNTQCYFRNLTFNCLNITHKFQDEICWN